jgi:hypothetical protein
MILQGKEEQHGGRKLWRLDFAGLLQKREMDLSLTDNLFITAACPQCIIYSFPQYE